MNDIEAKDIFAEAWRHFKSNWLKLTTITFVGFLLPLVAIVLLSVYLLDEPDLDDNAIGALALMILVFLLLVGFVFGSIFIKSLLRSICFRKITDRHNGSVSTYFSSCIESALVSKEFLFSIGCAGLATLFLSLGKSIEVGIYILLFWLLLFVSLVVSFLFMFAPYILMENTETKTFKNFGNALRLMRNNYKIVANTTLLCFLICLAMWCTGVGIVIAIPFRILVTAVLYQKISQRT